MLKMEDTVMFNGDPYKNNRIWKITKLHEDGKFATIQTNDMTGFSNPDDLIRVVNRADLQKMDALYQMSPESMPGGNKQQMPGQMPQRMFGQMSGQMPQQMPGQMPQQMQGGNLQMFDQMPQQMFGQMPHQMQPPISINLVNGNNNKTVEPTFAGGAYAGTTLSDGTSFGNSSSDGNPSYDGTSSGGTSFDAAPDIDSFLSKPMIRGGNNKVESDTPLNSLGNGKVSFVVKKV
jgi:hypothetical protein